jgi:hypothetical protein
MSRQVGADGTKIPYLNCGSIEDFPVPRGDKDQVGVQQVNNGLGRISIWTNS